ncbi:MAG: hypothetical protein R3C03_04430 [Pirellulaceae bacterium]
MAGVIPLGDADACDFSPDGNRLAVYSGILEPISIYDLTTGEQLKTLRNFSLQGTHDGRTHDVAWLNDRLILVGSDEVLDVEQEVRAWTYSLEPGSRSGLFHLGGNRFMVMFQNEGKVMELPHTNIENAITDGVVDQRTLLKPGDTVSIEIVPDLIPRDVVVKIQKRLTKQLSESGIKVGDGGAATIKIFVEQLPRQEVNVRNSSSSNQANGGNVSAMGFTPTRSHIQWIQDGKVVWESSHVNRPGPVLVGSVGENARTVMDRMCQPSELTFNIQFGNRIVALSSRGIPMGFTKLTVNGPVDE